MSALDALQHAAERGTWQEYAEAYAAALSADVNAVIHEAGRSAQLAIVRRLIADDPTLDSPST